MLKRIQCWLHGHQWEYEPHILGFFRIYQGYRCVRCGRIHISEEKK